MRVTQSPECTTVSLVLTMIADQSQIQRRENSPWRRFLRRHGWEAALALVVMAGALTFMIPRFLHGQRSYMRVIEPCRSLRSWEVRSGNWTVQDGHFTALPNEDDSDVWVLVHKQYLDAELLGSPIVLRFDARFPKVPSGPGSLWIGLGFGPPRKGETAPGYSRAVPTLASALRFEDGRFQGPMLYSRTAGWLGQASRDFMNIYSHHSPLGLRRPRGPAPPQLQGPHILPVEPDTWYRVDSLLKDIDYRSGGVEYAANVMGPGTIEIGSYSAYVECFDQPRSGLTFFIYQSGVQIPIHIDNIRMGVRSH